MLLLFILLFNVTAIYAKDDKGFLIVATREAPPFAMKNLEGKWEGVSIDLWKKIAQKLNLQYKFKEYKTLEGLMGSVRGDNIEVALSAITATADREKFADFSNGYYTEELAIAIPKHEGSIFKALLSKLFSYTTLWVFLGVVVVIHIAGLAFWYMEKDEIDNNESSIKGIDNGIWWAAVTMTTVGYGDVTPKTLGGKIVAIVWMFISMFLVAVMIAAITSLFTSTNREYFITKPNDLNSGSIATIEGSFSDKYLRDRGIFPVYYDNLKSVIDAVSKKEVDAAVYDKDLLKYIIDRDYKRKVKLTEAHFMPQNYAFMFKNSCKLKESINRALLEVTESEDWKKIKHTYLPR